ncbi:MAG: hypothetical protein U1E65_02365 [Myxococcota bacterium]
MTRSAVALLVLALSAGCTKPAPLGDYDSGVFIPDAYTLPDVGPRPDTGLADAGMDAGTRTTTYTWYRDIQPIVYAACIRCHQDPPLFGAPVPLLTFANLHALASDNVSQIHEIAACRVVGCSRTNIMPPRTEMRQLTTHEIQMIQNWSAGGAPAGDEPDGGAVFPDASEPHDAGPIPWADGGVDSDAGVPGLRWLDIFARDPANIAAPYHVPLMATSYECWSYPSGSVGNEHITQFIPVVDNVLHDHHALVFIDRTGTETSPNVVGPYDCVGIPRNTDLIGGWFPGWPPTVTPQGVGIPLGPRDRVVFQMHYDSVFTNDVYDNTGFRVLVDANAGLIDSAVLWVGARWEHTMNGPNEHIQGGCTLADHDITVWAISPHMHQTGTRVMFEISRQGGPWQPVQDVNPWDFHNQQVYGQTPLLQLRVGDAVRTQCWYDTQGRDVVAGEGSLDEMCYTYLNHYPPLSNPFRRCVEIQSP